jgi:anti-anti-sigma factor
MTVNSDPASGFRLSVRLADTVEVAVAGELDIVSAPDFAAVLAALVARGHGRITLECDELSFIDASGLGALAATRALLDPVAGEMSVHGLSDAAYRVFEITDLVDLFHAQRQNPKPHADESDEQEPDQVAKRVSRVVAESARADVLTDVLTHVTAMARNFIGSCDGASVTLRRADNLITAAASDETVRHLDEVQYTGDGGPCVDATHHGVQIHAPSLVDEQRWGPFTTQARDRGMESVLSSPLTVGEQPAGALNLYSRTPDAFRTSDRALASEFATFTAMLLHQLERTTAQQFEGRIRDALISRDVIARAQGVLMERLEVDAQDAYDTLRRDSAKSSIPLRQRALDIVEETQDHADAHDPEGRAHG